MLQLTITDSPELTELEDSDPMFQDLSLSFGETLWGLTRFTLSNTGVSTLPKTFGQTWDKLEAIAISKNQITELPANFGRTWKDTLRTVDIEEPALTLNNREIRALTRRWPHAAGYIGERIIIPFDHQNLPERPLSTIGILESPQYLRQVK